MTDAYEQPMPQEVSRRRLEALRAAAVAAAAKGKDARDERWELALTGLGLLILFVPTYVSLAQGAWTNPQDAHGPFVVAVAIGAAVARWRAFMAARGSAPLAALFMVIIGLGFYVIGRSQELLVLETASQLPILAGAILAMKGRQGLRAMWFPVLFLAFTIVWPGWMLDALTLPLKQVATATTVEVLRALNYPIVANGVIIIIGRYELLVADACSGLNTIISLMSVGVLYLYIARRRSLAWNLAILLAMPGFAFVANLLRVMSLTLITYHFGDDAGQSFLHSFTGLLLFGVALGLVFLLDAAIESVTAFLRRGTK